jgi:hypothetical protein
MDASERLMKQKKRIQWKKYFISQSLKSMFRSKEKIDISTECDCKNSLLPLKDNSMHSLVKMAMSNLEPSLDIPELSLPDRIVVKSCILTNNSKNSRGDVYFRVNIKNVSTSALSCIYISGFLFNDKQISHSSGNIAQELRPKEEVTLDVEAFGIGNIKLESCSIFISYNLEGSFHMQKTSCLISHIPLAVHSKMIFIKSVKVPSRNHVNQLLLDVQVNIFLF